MSWSSRSLAQSSKDSILQGRRELAKRFAEHHSGSTLSRRPASDDRRRLCWLCGLEIAIIEVGERTGVLSLAKTETSGHDLCLGCAEDTLRYVFLPLTSEKFISQDSACEDAISQFEANGGVSSSPCSPRSPQPSNSEWSCWRCTLVNHGLRTTCESCGSSRPADPICPRCDLNYLHHKLCLATKAKHETWECSRCQTNTVNIDELVECRACRKSRTWFCAACSLENSATHNNCTVCGSAGKLSSLRSFVNREMLRSYGIDTEVQDKQRKQIGQIELHTERLKHRIDSIGLQSVPIDDDGNCLFRALSYELVRTDIFYPVLRHMIADYMEDHQSEYSLLVGAQEFEGYVEGMRQNRVWGDELCVHAAARAFGVRVHVVTSEEQRWHLRYAPSDLQSLRQLFLAYRSPDHYFALQHSSREPSLPPVPLEDLLRSWFKELCGGSLAPQSSTQLSPGCSAGEYPPTPLRSGGTTSSMLAADPSQQLPPSLQRSLGYTAAGNSSSSSSNRPYPTQATAPPPSLPSSVVQPTTSTAVRPSPATHQLQQPQQQQLYPSLSSGGRFGMEQVIMTRQASDSPPLARRLPPSAVSSGAGTQQPQQQRFAVPSAPQTVSQPSLSHLQPPTRQPPAPPPVQSYTQPTAAQPPQARLPSTHHSSTTPSSSLARPPSRSSVNEFLPINMFHMLAHPVMVRLVVASNTSLTISTNDRDVLVQTMEGAFFYLYPISHKAIFQCGPSQYPWKDVYAQVCRDLQDAKVQQKPLLPMFLLQHIQTGGFVHPSEDVRLTTVFSDLPPIRITELNCKKTHQRISECLLTFRMDPNAPSRSKGQLQFVHCTTPCRFVSFVGNGSLFASEVPVPGSAVVFHQLFGGLPERLCLHCFQWYDASKQQQQQQQQGAGQRKGCAHFSWVNETLEQLQPTVPRR